MSTFYLFWLFKNFNSQEVGMTEHSEEKLPCFCKECGSKLRENNTNKIKTCSTDHERYRSYGYNYCPDCRKKL